MGKKKIFQRPEDRPFGSSDSNENDKFYSKEGGKKDKKKIFIFVAVIVVVFIAAYFLINFFVISPEKGKPGKVSDIGEVKSVVGKIRKLESDVQEKQNEMFRLMKQYKNNTGKPLPVVNSMNLSKEEKEVLQRMINEERDISVKSLIQNTLDKDKQIGNLQLRINELEEKLPSPHVVQRGDSHFDIALNFLKNKKEIETEQAKELINRSMLYDNLIPGFKVWNYYSEGVFGSFITQGDADVSPNYVRRKAKKKIIDARDEAISAKIRLAKEIEAMEIRKEILISDLESLRNEKNSLISKINELSKQNEKIQKRLNSLYYIVDLKNKLKNKGILQGTGFLFLSTTKVANMSPENFNKSIDLREDNKIDVFAQYLNVNKIENVKIFPKYYEEGKDYKIIYAKNKKTARIEIISKDELKNMRIVIAVQD